MEGQYLIYGLAGIILLFFNDKIIKMADKNTYKWYHRRCNIIFS